MQRKKVGLFGSNSGIVFKTLKVNVYLEFLSFKNSSEAKAVLNGGALKSEGGVCVQFNLLEMSFPSAGQAVFSFL